MALALVKNGTTDEFSVGDGSDPITLADVQLDETGGTVDSAVLNIEIRADTYLYENIGLSVQNEESGIDWKFSLDQSNWHDSLVGGAADDAVAGEIGPMDATGAPVTKDIYLKAVVTNTSAVAAGAHITPDIRLTRNRIE